MAFEIDTFEQRWKALRHPLLNFFFNAHHPDINIDAADARHGAPAGRPPHAGTVAGAPRDAHGISSHIA